MAKEREIKLRIVDLPGLQRILAKLGARIAKPRVHEHNTLFDTPESTLGKRRQLLRIRTETRPAQSSGGQKSRSRSVVTFKRPILAGRASEKGERHKVREEIELEISDPKALGTVLEGLGLRRWFQYEKFRTTFRLPASNAWAKKLLIELDETPIGVFLELEGPAKAIDRAAQALGFREKDFILANYMVLHRQFARSRGKEAGDMLFGKQKGGPASIATSTTTSAKTNFSA